MQKKVGWYVVAVVAAYIIIGMLTLAQGQQGISGRRGEIWNQIDRASQLLERLEQQLDFGVTELAKINSDIVAARSDLVAAQQSGDLAAALSAANKAQGAINVAFEAYPQYFNLTETFVGLQDETAGSFNRIAYARQQLIEGQVGYNKNRILFAPLSPFFSAENVLGADLDITAPVAPSTLGK